MTPTQMPDEVYCDIDDDTGHHYWDKHLKYGTRYIRADLSPNGCEEICGETDTVGNPLCCKNKPPVDGIYTEARESFFYLRGALKALTENHGTISGKALNMYADNLLETHMPRIEKLIRAAQSANKVEVVTADQVLHCFRNCEGDVDLGFFMVDRLKEDHENSAKIKPDAESGE